MALPTAPDTLVVSEVVPATVVGDGPTAGWRCALIRLGGCNLACTWCDVPYSWDGTMVDLNVALRQRLVKTVLDDALSASPGLVLITGGEPLLQQRAGGWSALLQALRQQGVETEVHTNGTLAPGAETVDLVNRFVVSPKLSHSGEPTWTRILPDVLQSWAALVEQGKVAFSFVVRDRMDVQTVTTLTTLHGIPHGLVWISPEATTTTRLVEVTAEVAETALDHGFNLATRVGLLAARRRAAVA